MVFERNVGADHDLYLYDPSTTATTVLGNTVRRLAPVPLFGGRTEIEALTRGRQVAIDRAVR